MKSGFGMFAAVLMLAAGSSLTATTLFSGNFATVSVSTASKDLSVNYPRPGADEICGFEIKSNVIVLHRSVWERLASKLEAFEIHDDAAGVPVSASIEASYSPRLMYRFTRLESDYGTIRLVSKDGRSLQDVFSDVLASGKGPVTAIAVAVECP
jgi:hypothetical protein